MGVAISAPIFFFMCLVQYINLYFLMRTLMLQPRLAQLTDAHALLALQQQVFEGDLLSLDRFRYFLRSSHNELWCIEEDGVLLGYALVLFRRNSTKARLYSLAVAPHARGRQLGQHLLQWVEQQARLRERLFMRLEVRHDNLAALQLYQRSGYQIIRQLPAYYADGADGWRLEKDLRTHKEG